MWARSGRRSSCRIGLQVLGTGILLSSPRTFLNLFFCLLKWMPGPFARMCEEMHDADCRSFLCYVGERRTKERFIWYSLGNEWEAMFFNIGASHTFFLPKTQINHVGGIFSSNNEKTKFNSNFCFIRFSTKFSKFYSCCDL